MTRLTNLFFFGCSVLCVLSCLSPTTFADVDNVSTDCVSDKLIMYKVVLHTFWTSSRFPKHYPQWRPPAQWSPLIGRTHGKSYSLFRVGQKASPGMKIFTETGKADELNGDSGQGENDVYDVFGAPAIPTGSGRTETQFIVDGNHSLVSLISRIIPSPDWFIGVDSFNLCVNNNWLDSITIEANPMDAGTDNGFTFTAPNWPTEPQGVIFHMSSKYPSHPAGSFYYPQLKRLPPIATFQFIKVRAYDLSEVFSRTEDEKKYEVFKIADQQKYDAFDIDSNEVDQEIDGQQLEQEIRLKNEEMIKNRTSEVESVTTARIDSYSTANTNSSINDYFRRHEAKMKARRHFYRWKKHSTKNCIVSEWGDWSSCSAECGVGEMRRKRDILKYPKSKGLPCPPLIETKWCRNNSSCNDTFSFKW